MFSHDTIEHAGRQYRVDIESDMDSPAPWDGEDGHGPVSGWKRHAFGMGSKPPKAPGELILTWVSGSYRTYDFAEACRIARREWVGEGTIGGESARQRAAKAARADFERLAAWCQDQWCYVGVVVTLLDEDGEPTEHSESLWGIESDAYDYHREVANELAEQIGATLTSLDTVGELGDPVA